MKIVLCIAAAFAASMPGNSVAVNLVATNLEEQTRASSMMAAIVNAKDRMAQAQLVSHDT